MLKHTEILEIESYDNYKILGKLDLPLNDNIQKLIIYVNGSGPNSYENHRKFKETEFNYYDFFTDELIKRNIAFFRYSTRGVYLGPEPPLYIQVNDEEYAKYLPSNSVKDIEAIINNLKDKPELKNARVFLLGWSEGTIIAPLVVSNGNVDIQGLLLAGYCNDVLNDIIDWQFSGKSSMIFYKRCFDLDDKGYINKSDFDMDKFGVRNTVLKGVEFENIDVNNDGIIDISDFQANQAIKKSRNNLYEAIHRGDDEWLKNNYPVRLTSKWFIEHFTLSPNKETLLNIDIPIHIFHGKYDQSCPIEGVYDIDKRFRMKNKDNLYTHIFDNHDHDLNYMDYIIKTNMSDGFKSIFEVCESL